MVLYSISSFQVNPFDTFLIVYFLPPRGIASLAQHRLLSLALQRKNHYKYDLPVNSSPSRVHDANWRGRDVFKYFSPAIYTQISYSWGTQWVKVELMTKSCFYRVRVMVQKYFLSQLILRNKICFLCFLQFLLFILTWF